MRSFIYILAACVWLFSASAAFAGESEVITNDNFSLNITAPEGWVADKLGTDPKLIASFSHEATAGKIELLGARIVRDEHALVLFETFRERLQNDGFVQVGTDQTLTLGEREGILSEFDFTNSDVKMRVMVFCFVERSVAYAAIAYVARADRENVRIELENVVGSIKDVVQ